MIPEKNIAQETPSAIQFHGSNVLYGQYISRQDINSNVPGQLVRNDLQMTLTAYDIPIATKFFIISEQLDYKQNIDNLSFYIDLNTLKRNKARIEAKNKTNGSAKAKAPWRLRFLSKFSRIEAGKFRPAYGDLTLRGVSVSGVNIEFTDKHLYAAFATGQLKKATVGAYSADTTFKRKLLFGKLGYGEKNRSHFYLTYMQIEDEAEKGAWDAQVGDTAKKPMSNMVLGAEFRVSLFKRRWVFDGNAGLSFLTRDTRNPVSYDSLIQNSDFDKLPQFMIDAVNPNISSSYDYAYGFSTKLRLRTTTISGAYSLVNSGYSTLGNPNLVNDRQTFDGRVDQAFLKRKLTVSAFFKQYKDNLINWKDATTVNTSYGINVRLSIRNIPYFQISFAPNRQERNGEGSYVSNSMNVIAASSGYNYPIGRLKSFTSLSYFYQNAYFEYDSSYSFDDRQTFTLSQMLSFKIPLRLNANASYSKAESSGFDRNVVSAILSATHQAFENKWKNTLGGRLLQSKGDREQSKFSVYWETVVKLWDGGDLEFHVEENILQDRIDVDNNFNEIIARCKLIVRW